MRVVFRFADDDLDDLAVLSEVLRPAQSFEKLVFLGGGAESGHINQILLHHTQAGKVFPAQGICFSLLRFLLLRSNVLLLPRRLSSIPGFGSDGN